MYVSLGTTEFGPSKFEKFSAVSEAPLPALSDAVATTFPYLNDTIKAEFGKYGYYFKEALTLTTDGTKLDKVLLLSLNTMVCNTLNMALLKEKLDVGG